ncbi:MAG: AraC family transcriptional regulator [Rhodobacteraceae bacterium]|nr:MAG: AraC family transcriptional regulator [Paracoccaceae bacterium]
MPPDDALPESLPEEWTQAAALAETPPARGETVRLWRPRPGLECLSAHFTAHRYAPHRHDTFVIGVNLSGVEVFDARGARHLAGPGQMMVLNPDELHDGRALEGHYRYRAFYPSIDMLRGVAADMIGDPGAAVAEPAFDALAFEDPALAARLLRLHRLLEDGADPLALDEALTATFAALIARHAGTRLRPPEAGREDRRVARVIEAVDAEPGAAWRLDDLAALAGLSRYHFIRVFRRATGQSPLAYVTTRRLGLARRLLAHGERPAEVAVACGFADQAHLTRLFGRAFGIAPGRYARAVRP